MQVDVQLVRQAVPSFVRESNVLDNLLEEVRQRDQTDSHTAAPTARHRPFITSASTYKLCQPATH